MAFPSVYEMTNPLTTVRKQHFWEYFSGATLPTNAQYIDDFSTNNGWVSNAGQSNVVYQSNSLKLNDPGVSVENQVVLDLQSVIGKNASDNAWYLELEVQFSSASGADNEFMYGLSSTDKDGGQQDAQDFLGAAVLINYSASQDGINVSNSLNTIVKPAASAGNAYYQLSTGVTYIFIIRRLSPTTAKVEIWNADKSTRLANGAEYTIDAGINNLRYFKFLNYPGASTNIAQICNKLTFYDGTSDPSAPTTRWTTTDIQGNPATFAMSDSVDGGFSITTGSSSSDQSEIDFNDKRQYAHDGSVFICSAKRVSASSLFRTGLTANITDSNTNRIIIENNSGQTYCRFEAFDGSTGLGAASTTTPADTNWHNFKAVLNGSSAVLTVDGVTDATTTRGSNVPVTNLQPYFFGQTLTGSSAVLSIKYMECYNT